MTATVTTSGRTGTFISTGPSVAATVIASIAAVAVWHVSASEGYNLGALYAGVLGLLSIFSGFLATFYVFVATGGNAFMNAIRQTGTFRQLVTLLRFTLVWTVGTCAFTLAMSVVEPRGFALVSLPMLAIAAWVWSVSMIIVNFWRCTRMFVRIVETQGP